MVGPIEGGVEVANKIADSLKAQPLCLALLVMNVGLIGYLFYAEYNSTVNRQILFDRIMQGQSNVQELLSHCTVPIPVPKG